VAGCAPVLGVILDRIERAGPGRGHWLPYNSGEALEQLAAGTIHVAGLHLEDPESGEDHRALLRRRFAGEAVRLVRLVRWRTGLGVRPEHRDRGLPELLDAPIRWVQRESGAGVQRVLARVLARLGVTVDRLTTTHVAPSHHEVGQAIALRVADVGVLVEPVARELGLAFVPLVEEGFDLAVREAHAAPPAVARMLDALDDPALRREIACLGPYDTATLGHATLA
jgi:putative molybdopterin biosynthesis protein